MRARAGRAPRVVSEGEFTHTVSAVLVVLFVAGLHGLLDDVTLRTLGEGESGSVFQPVLLPCLLGGVCVLLGGVGLGDGFGGVHLVRLPPRLFGLVVGVHEDLPIVAGLADITLPVVRKGQHPGMKSGAAMVVNEWEGPLPGCVIHTSMRREWNTPPVKLGISASRLRAPSLARWSPRMRAV